MINLNNFEKGLAEIVRDLALVHTNDVLPFRLEDIGYQRVSGHKPLLVKTYDNYAICYVQNRDGRYDFLSVVRCNQH